MEKSMSFSRSYRITEQTIKSKQNLKVKIWHITGDTFTVSIYENDKKTSWNSHNSWGYTVHICKVLRRWGVKLDCFEVWGSTVHTTEELRNLLESK